MATDPNDIITWAAGIVTAAVGTAFAVQKTLRTFTRNNTEIGLAKAEIDMLSRMQQELERMSVEHAKLHIALIESNDQLRLVNTKLAHLELSMMRMYNIIEIHGLPLPDGVMQHIESIRDPELQVSDRRSLPRIVKGSSGSIPIQAANREIGVIEPP